MNSEFKRYEYKGPIYYYGNKIASKSDFYTMAKTWKQARNNILFKAANGDLITRYDIVDDLVVQSSENDNFDIADEIIHTCETCGYQLNDAGECPVCDYGEYDLLDLEG